MSTARTTVPESLLAELAAGQSYFRDHYDHASREVVHLKHVVDCDNALVGDLRKKIELLELRVADAMLERQQVLHDLAVQFRWIELQAAGVEVMGSEDHGFSAACARLELLSREGMAKIIEAHEWGKQFEAAGKTDGAKE